MNSEFTPFFCFVYSLYDDDGSYFRGRDDYLLIFYKRPKGPDTEEVLLDIKEFSPWSGEKEVEEYRNLAEEFEEIYCNSEIVVNDYDFLTFAKKDTYKRIAVEIFLALSQHKLKYKIEEGENPLKRELFEKIWTEFKEIYYSAVLDDLM